MKFVSCNTSIAVAVQMADEIIHEVKKIIFAGIVVLPVEPVDDIASH